MIWIIAFLLLVIVVGYIYTQYWQVDHLKEDAERLKGDIEALEIERKQHLKAMEELGERRKKLRHKNSSINNPDDAIDFFRETTNKLH